MGRKGARPLCALFQSAVIIEADEVTGRVERIPGDMQPAAGGQQLVGVFAGTKEVDEPLELRRVFGADIGSLADEVLRVADTADLAVNGRTAEAGVDDDGADDAPRGLQELMTTVGHIDHGLHGRDVFGVFVQTEEFA